MDSDTRTGVGVEPGPMGRNALIVAAVIVAFVAAHFALRSLVTPSVHGDDADLIVFDQSLEWGYHAQPPLYSWLYRGVSSFCGRNLLSLNLLRSLLLAATAWMTYLSMRRLVSDERLRSLGAFSALAAPMVAWHAITYLTHTLLVCAACAAALHAALRVAQRGRWGDYVWLGVVCGFGVLSKYNFAVFALALLLSGLTVAPLRRRLLTRRMSVATLIAGLICSPHVWWLAENVDAVRGEYSHKLESAAEVGPANALLHLYKNYALLALPTIAIFVACFPTLRNRARSWVGSGAPAEAWIARYFLAVLALYSVSIVVTGAGKFHERWLEPLFLLAPVFFLCVVDRIGATPLGLRRFGYALATLALVTMGVRAGQVWLGNSHRGYISMDYSYEAAADELERVARDSVLVVDNHEVGGNLINSDERIACVCADHTAYKPHWSKRLDSYVLVWSAEHGDHAPDHLSEYVRGELEFTPLVAEEATLVELGAIYEGQSPQRLYYQKVQRTRAVARTDVEGSGRGLL